jgi:hypothetical protein
MLTKCARLEMSCVMEHIDTTASDHEASQNVLRVGSTRVISRPLGMLTSHKDPPSRSLHVCYTSPNLTIIFLVVWTAATSALQGYPRRPLVVVVSGSAGDIVSKIANHYIQVSRRAVKHERWNRLRANQAWIYLDLCFLFTHWENVWGTVKQNLHVQTQVSLKHSAEVCIRANQENRKFLDEETYCQFLTKPDNCTQTTT